MSWIATPTITASRQSGTINHMWHIKDRWRHPTIRQTAKVFNGHGDTPAIQHWVVISRIGAAPRHYDKPTVRHNILFALYFLLWAVKSVLSCLLHIWRTFFLFPVQQDRTPTVFLVVLPRTYFCFLPNSDKSISITFWNPSTYLPIFVLSDEFTFLNISK